MGKFSRSLSLVRLAASLGILSASTQSLASEQLDVVSTVGPTKSTAAYFENISWVDVKETLLDEVDSIANYREILADDVFFPLTTDLTPGRLSSKEFVEPKPIHQPFVVVGSDSLSMEWLRYRYDHLVDVGAVIYVVSAKSFDQLVAIREKMDPLVVAPGNGNAIGRSLMLERYPFMVNKDGVWQ